MKYKDKILVENGSAFVPVNSPQWTGHIRCATKLQDGTYKFSDVSIEISDAPNDDKFAPNGAYILVKK